MKLSIQKGSFGKRIVAYFFDMILAVILAIGCATVISKIVKYDSYFDKLDAYYEQYEEKYGIDLEISDEEYEKLSAEEKAKYEEADAAIKKDKDVLQTYNMMFYLTLVIVTLAILISHILIYFIVPLLFKNGQTLGKKIFSLAVMRTDYVRVTHPVMFVRSILGLFAVETMVPVVLLVMLYFGSIGFAGILVMFLIFILQIGLLIATSNNTAIHDSFASTVVVDFTTQTMFDSNEARDAYRQEQAALEAERASY